MSKTKRQNPIYIATTISVYLGLVLVGASPQVFAQSGFSGDAQSRIFEFTSKTSSVLSKLKIRQDSVTELTADFPSSGRFAFLSSCRPATVTSPLSFTTDLTPIHTNEQILTVSVLPRASI